MYPVLAAGARGAAFGVLAGAVHDAVARLAFQPADPGGRFAIGPGAGLELPLHAVAWSAAQLLTSADAGAVHACPGDGCGWLFIDRRGRRRWCTMQVCGNRAKVKAFADRRRHG